MNSIKLAELTVTGFSLALVFSSCGARNNNGNSGSEGSGSGTSNSTGVAKVLAALQAITPFATAMLHGTSGPKGGL